MAPLDHLAVLLPPVDDVLRPASLTAWVICLVCLFPAVWRMLHRRGLYLDPIWLLVFLLAINRVTFLLKVSAPLSHASAAILALVMAGFSTWYQINDRR